MGLDDRLGGRFVLLDLMKRRHRPDSSSEVCSNGRSEVIRCPDYRKLFECIDLYNVAGAAVMTLYDEAFFVQQKLNRTLFRRKEAGERLVDIYVEVVPFGTAVVDFARSAKRGVIDGSQWRITSQNNETVTV